MRATDVVRGLIVLFLVAAAAVGYVVWQMEGVIGLHGWIALGVGCALTLGLLAVLLGLMFYSHRKGFDDDAGHL